MPAEPQPEHQQEHQPALSRRERRAAKNGGGGKIPAQRQFGAVVNPRQYAVRRRG
jgi:hypothetical protein